MVSKSLIVGLFYFIKWEECYMAKQLVRNFEEVPAIMDIPYAARLLGRSSDSLKKLAQDGRLLGAFKIGSQWRIAKSKLIEHIGE